jgi:hypothetical protein
MKPQLKIYCAAQITGKTWNEVIKYYKHITRLFSGMGYIVFNPMVNKGSGGSDSVIGPGNYKTTNPSLSNKAIKKRDGWMVRQADVVLIDFTGTQTASIGMVSELAIADFMGKHTVVVMERTNVHNHAFVLEESDVIFGDMHSALLYLGKLINQEI